MKKNKKNNNNNKKTDDEDDDVENAEDQSGRKKVTVNYLSTLGSPSKNPQSLGVCSVVVAGIH